MNEQQIERYSRQIMLREIGGRGQKKLLAGRVLIIGVGGLGSPIALYLAAAGVGTIGIADADEVSISNLQRQVIHATPDIGRKKVESAREKMAAINPDVLVRTHDEWVSAANIEGIISDYDFVIDATDNFVAKFLINDACVLTGKSYSHGGILQFFGQTMTVQPRRSACYRCIFPAYPNRDVIPTSSRAGVLGVLPGVIGTIQATEAIKFLLGTGRLLNDRFLTYDAIDMEFMTMDIGRNGNCPICGDHPTITGLGDALGLGRCNLLRSAN